jgi:hypothetical protein
MASERPSGQVVAFRGRFVSAPAIRHAEVDRSPRLFHRVAAAIASHGLGTHPDDVWVGLSEKLVMSVLTLSLVAFCLRRSREALETFAPARSAVATAGPSGILSAAWSR